MHLKVSLSVWWLLLNQLAMKDKLVHHGILTTTSFLCSSGCEKEESIDHLFVGCAYLGGIWIFLQHWLGISTADILHIFDHFAQFTNETGDSRKIWSSFDMDSVCLDSLEGKKQSYFSAKIIDFTTSWWQSETSLFLMLKRRNTNVSFDFHHGWINLI